MITNKIKIINNRGEFISFGRHFRLIEGFDLSNLLAEVNYSESTRDGASYQSTVLSRREFDISFFVFNDYRERWWVEEKRRELFRTLNPKHNPFRIEFTTKAGESYYLNANLEGTPSLPQRFENDNRVWQKALIQFSCDDPFIYQSGATNVDIATWIGAFEFPLEIPEGLGIEMGYRSESLIANVINDGDNVTGMMIKFKALGTVVNPQLINVDTRDEFKLNFTMDGGDVIEISTYIGKKSVTLIRNNERINLFNVVDFDSVFLQLEPGDNIFRYDADDGLGQLEVSMSFTNRYVGV